MFKILNLFIYLKILSFKTKNRITWTIKTESLKTRNKIHFRQISVLDNNLMIFFSTGKFHGIFHLRQNSVIDRVHFHSFY